MYSRRSDSIKKYFIFKTLIEDLRRKLKGYEMTATASGEDFIHPKAKAGMLRTMMQASI
jgi:hypothetical protein